MKKQNYILKILNALGMASITPTDALLAELNGMSNIRFFQILNNKSKAEMDVLEAELLTAWLYRLTGRELDIFDQHVTDNLETARV